VDEQTINLTVVPGWSTNLNASNVDIYINNSTNTRTFSLSYALDVNNSYFRLQVIDSLTGVLYNESNRPGTGDTIRNAKIVRSSNTILFYENDMITPLPLSTPINTPIGKTLSIRLWKRGVNGLSPSVSNFTMTNSIPSNYSLLAGGDIVPNLPLTYNLGSAFYPFDYLYASSINMGSAVGIGTNAGSTGQGAGSIAIGDNAGYTGQGGTTGYAIAIGYGAGYTNHVQVL
jgi:hypothetical protein